MDNSLLIHTLYLVCICNTANVMQYYNKNIVTTFPCIAFGFIYKCK